MGGRVRLIIASLLATAPAYALDTTTISKSMGDFWNLLGSFFTFDRFVTDPTIRVGILKFLIFILLLRIVQVTTLNYVFKGDRKTATVVGFVVAAITVIFTPNAFVFSAIVALAVPLAIIITLILLVFRKSKKTGTYPFAGSFAKSLAGAGLLLLAAALTKLFIDMFTRFQQMEPEFMRPFVLGALDMLYVICIILFVVKLLLMLFEDPPTDTKVNWPFGGNGAPAQSNLQSQAQALSDQAEANPTQPSGGAGAPDPQTGEPTEGKLEGLVFTVGADGRATPAPNATVWAQRNGTELARANANASGEFSLTVPLASNDMIVHATLDGFQEGIHINTTYGGNPAALLQTSATHPVVRHIRVPLLLPEPVDPQQFDPKHAVVLTKQLPDPRTPADKPFSPAKAERKEPRTFVDLAPGFLPVEDQHPFGSCTAFAVGSIMEYLRNVERGGLLAEHRVSKMHLWIHTRIKDGPDPAQWGAISGEVCTWVRDHGVAKATLWPYDPALLHPPAAADPLYNQWLAAENDAPQQTVTEHNVIAVGDIPDTLLSGFPAAIGIPVYDNFVRHHGTELLSGYSGTMYGYHAIVIVGYDSHRPSGKGATVPAYKIRNSWGTPWGAYGYAWIEEKTLFQLLQERGGQIRILRGPQAKPHPGAAGTIIGRVILDERDPKHTEATGEDLYKDKRIPAFKGELQVVAFAQRDGKLLRVGGPAIPDENGHFQLKVEHPLPLEPFPASNAELQQAMGFNPADAGAGVLVAAIHKQDEPGFSTHVVSKQVSHLGRGGMHAPKAPLQPDHRNPPAPGAFSGLLINFSDKHTEEKWVIIPVPVPKKRQAHKQLEDLRAHIVQALKAVKTAELRKVAEETQFEKDATYYWLQKELHALEAAFTQVHASIGATHEQLNGFLDLLQETHKEKYTAFKALVDHIEQKLFHLQELFKEIDAAIAKKNAQDANADAQLAALTREYPPEALRTILMELAKLIDELRHAFEALVLQ